MYLSLVVPAYNEEKRIIKTLKEIDAYLAKKNFEYEILVVSDGSTDNTVKVVNDLKIPHLTVLDNKKNNGKGYVVRQGLLAGKGQYRLFADADNSTPINQLDKLLPYIRDYDIVIASRAIKGAVIPVPQPFRRRALGNLYRLLAKLIVGIWGIQDSQCGFKLFTQESINDILPKCRVDGLSFDPEILIIAKKLGYKVKEVPVVWIDDADSKINFSRMQKMGFGLFKIRWNIIRGKYQSEQDTNYHQFEKPKSRMSS